MMEKHDRGNRKVQYLITFSVSLLSVGMGIYTAWPGPVIPKFNDNETDFEVTNVNNITYVALILQVAKSLVLWKSETTTIPQTQTRDNIEQFFYIDPAVDRKWYVRDTCKPAEISWIVAISSPGFVAGNLVSRFVVDKYGRRATMLGSVIPLIAATLIVAFSAQTWPLYLVRLLWGVGVGVNATTINIYLAEIADKEIRGSLGLIARYMFSFGSLLMMCVGPFVSYKVLNYMLLALPFVHLLACFWVPESPHYCLKEGKVEKARKVLRKIRGCKDEKILENQLLQLQADVKNDMRHSSSAKELFTGKKYRRALIISTGLKFSQIAAGQLIIQEYLGLIMNETESEMALSTVFILVGSLRFIVGVLASFLVDKLGRRPLLIYSYGSTGVSLLAVGIYFFLVQALNVSIPSFSFIPLAGIMSACIFSGLGFQSLIILVPAEIFPLNVKAVAMTYICILGGALNFIIAKGYQSIKDYSGLYGVFWVFAAGAIFGCIFTIFYFPETKGKSLTEIQMELQGVFYDSSEVKNLNDICRDDNNGCRELKELVTKNSNHV